MYVGHYAVSYALKRVEGSLSVGELFLAVQGVDVAWSALVLLGVEKVQIVPGFLPASSLNLYYMPYTHSLPGALLWAVLIGLAYWFWGRWPAPQRWRRAAVMGAAVFSHWLLDLLVHGPDLGLLGDAHKVGLGLWQYPGLTFGLEALLLLGGLALYLGKGRGATGGGRFGQVLFAVGLLVVNAVNLFGLQVAMAPQLFASMALVSYFAFAGVAQWLGRPRGAVSIVDSPSR